MDAAIADEGQHTLPPDPHDLALQLENAALRERVAELERRLASYEAQDVPYHALFDALPVPVVLYRVDGLAVAINRRNEQLVGAMRDSIVGRHNIFTDPQAVDMGYVACFKGALQGNIVQMPATAYDTGKSSLDERLDDRQIWSETTYFPIRDQAGQIVFVGELNLDVTERERAAAEERRLNLALQERERRFRGLFDNAAIGVALITPDRHVIESNAALQIMLGYTADELRGTSFRQVTHADDIEPDAALFAELLSGARSSYQIEKRYLRKDGLTLVGRMTASLVRDPSGRVEFGISMVEDVTDRLQIERKMVEAQKLESLGLLAGGIAHDFNNLLVALLGNASLVLEELPLDAPVRASVEHIEVAARRAAELTRQILAYAGKGRFVVQRINLNDMVYEISHLLQAAIPKHVELRPALALSTPEIEGDATQIRQVIMNLMVNAAEAIDGPAGVVKLTTGVRWVDKAYLSDALVSGEIAEGLYATIEVSDTGVGMDLATQRKIFDPFFTTKFTGRGLGLAAVMGIVRGHKGAIKLVSAPGQGSCFTILLPAADIATLLQAEVSSQAVPWRGSGTVLVIDDEPDVRAVASRMIERLGFAVLAAPNATTGAALFREHASSITCVLLDMTMPHLTGRDAFLMLRQIDPAVRVVAMSGYNEQEVTRQFASHDLVGFLPKPFTALDLRQMLWSVAAPVASPKETAAPR